MKHQVVTGESVPRRFESLRELVMFESLTVPSVEPEAICLLSEVTLNDRLSLSGRALTLSKILLLNFSTFLLQLAACGICDTVDHV